MKEGEEVVLQNKVYIVVKTPIGLVLMPKDAPEVIVKQ